MAQMAPTASRLRLARSPAPADRPLRTPPPPLSPPPPPSPPPPSPPHHPRASRRRRPAAGRIRKRAEPVAAPPPEPRLDYGNLAMAAPELARSRQARAGATDDDDGVAARVSTRIARIEQLALPPGTSREWAHTYDYAFASDGTVDIASDGAWHSIALTSRAGNREDSPRRGAARAARRVPRRRDRRIRSTGRCCPDRSTSTIAGNSSSRARSTTRRRAAPSTSGSASIRRSRSRATSSSTRRRPACCAARCDSSTRSRSTSRICRRAPIELEVRERVPVDARRR